MKGNLKEHNIPVYEKLENMMAEKNKALVVTATGTGKSYLTLEYITRHNLNTLVVVPRLSIGREWDKMSKKISTITYHSFGRTNDFDKYDCVVFDEVHHAGATTWEGPITNFINTTDKPVIGLTADPKRYSNGARDMGEELFGDCRIDGYSLTDAIEQNILPSLTYVAAMWNIGGMKVKFSDKDIPSPLLARFNYALDKREPVEDIIVRHMPKGARKGIIFVETIPACREAQNLINSVYPKAKVWTIHSKQSTNLNEQYHNEFKKAKTGFMIAVDMYNEGLHAPGVNTIIMLRRTSSPTIFYQQIGRALHVGNSNDPIIFDLVCNSNLLKIKSTQRERMNRGATLTKYIPAISNQTVIYDYTKDILDVIDEIHNYLDDTWTDEEDAILKKYYPDEGLGIISRLPGRSKDAIMSRACIFGIASNINPEWTEEEDNIMREYYPSEGRNVYKRFPNRTKSACANRAIKLNLVTDYGKWSKEEIEILKKYYPIEGKKVIERLHKKTETALYAKASKLGILIKNMPWTNEEIEILKKYYPDEGVDVAKRLPGRSIETIKKEAQIVGIKVKKGGDWTEEEIEILRKYFPTEGYDVIKRLPWRTRNGVVRKAKEYGIKRDGNYYRRWNK